MAAQLPTLLGRQSTGSAEPEVDDLLALQECGLHVARIVVVPAGAEAEFYRLNNLPERLTALFEGIDLSDPDDEDIEDLAPEAVSLLAGHYLLDEFIDRFYELIGSLPTPLRVRRPGEDGAKSEGARGGLLAVKGAWSAEWEFERLWERLSHGGPLVPVPRPLLLHAATLGPLPHALSEDASAILGKRLSLRGDPSTGISRIVGA